ncbi:MAG TPA: hypothetical protein VH054_01300 [Polyangiaceae bacterium]|nr:hypothetical protein [Polyangiaceae bacterium]
MKRTIIFLAACSARSFDTTPPPDATTSTLVACETTKTCALECTTPSSWTTIDCKPIERDACTDTHESGTAYGCTLECSYATRVVASCNVDPTSSK